MAKFEIEVPDGYKVVSTAEGKWELKKIELPKTWDEFCEMHPVKKGEAYIDRESSINVIEKNQPSSKDAVEDRNLLPNKKTAEAFLALMQLVQLRDCYRGGWVPNWTDGTTKYVIDFYVDVLDVECLKVAQRPLSFADKDTARQFLINFRDLIETAKELI